nr:MAG TPA: hypothetical protein [Caudoviricetes sp.]
MIPPLLLHICRDVLKVGFEIRAMRLPEKPMLDTAK